jgi:aminoglycoside 3-N-acetyltransferase
MTGEQKPIVTYRDVYNGLRKLELDRGKPVMAHASLSAFGEVRGGADTVLAAVLGLVDALVMPVFTYRSLIIPETGPEDNACPYGTGKDQNSMAEFFKPDMPADRTMGVVAETLRRRVGVLRSAHPILSFAGYKADTVIQSQTLQDPFAPIGALIDLDAWVLLLGVDHTVNTSLHFAEKLAGRKRFVRWALTTEGVRECPDFPGDSDGFNGAVPWLDEITRKAQIGSAVVMALPLREMTAIVRQKLEVDPTALLCQRPDCGVCNAIRAVRV